MLPVAQEPPEEEVPDGGVTEVLDGARHRTSTAGCVARALFRPMPMGCLRAHSFTTKACNQKEPTKLRAPLGQAPTA